MKSKKKDKQRIGTKWRFQAYTVDGKKKLEVRCTPTNLAASGLEIDFQPFISQFIKLEKDIEFDELCVDNWFHIEQMGKDHWWVRLGQTTFDIYINGDGTTNLILQEGGEHIERIELE